MEVGGSVAEGKDPVPKFRTGSVVCFQNSYFSGFLQMTYWPILSFIRRLCVCSFIKLQSRNCCSKLSYICTTLICTEGTIIVMNGRDAPKDFPTRCSYRASSGSVPLLQVRQEALSFSH